MLVVATALGDFPGFTKGLEEIVSGDGGLALEVRKPENTGMDAAEAANHLVRDVVVDDVFEVNLVQVVSPGVEHGEALVLNALDAVLLDVLSDEFKVSLVGTDRVGKVVLVNSFLGVADERVDRLDAGGGLKVLVLNLRVEDGGECVVAADIKGLKDADKDLLEALHVPVLVDGGVDDMGGEDLLTLVGQKEDQIVHIVDSFLVAQVGGTELGQKLLEQQVDGGTHAFTELFVLAGVHGRELDLVGKGTTD